MQQLANPLLQTLPVKSIRSCPFWKRQIVPTDMYNFADCVMSAHKFCCFLNMTFSVLFQLLRLSQLWQSPVPLQFLLHDVVIAVDAMPSHWGFYFQGSGLFSSFSKTWSGSMQKVYTALQKLQEVVLILNTMAFHLSCKVFALHLDNSTA